MLRSLKDLHGEIKYKRGTDEKNKEHLFKNL